MKYREYPREKRSVLQFEYSSFHSVEERYIRGKEAITAELQGKTCVSCFIMYHRPAFIDHVILLALRLSLSLKRVIKTYFKSHKEK